MQKKSPSLTGDTRADRKQAEDDLLVYVAFLSKVMHHAEGTIRQTFFAATFAHTVSGLADPLLSLLRRERLWAALPGFKR